MQTLYFFIPLKICFGDDHFTECHCFSGFLPVYYPTQIVKIICTLNMINVHFFVYIYISRSKWPFTKRKWRNWRKKFWDTMPSFKSHNSAHQDSSTKLLFWFRSTKWKGNLTIQRFKFSRIDRVAVSGFSSLVYTWYSRKTALSNQGSSTFMRYHRFYVKSNNIKISSWQKYLFRGILFTGPHNIIRPWKSLYFLTSTLVFL